MKGSRIWKSRLIRKWSSVILVVALTAGGISLASFAQGFGTGWGIGLEVEEFSAGRHASPSQATPPDALEEEREILMSTPFSLAELLEQESAMNDNVMPMRYQVFLNGETVVDSNGSSGGSTVWESGQMIAGDAQIRHRIEADFYAQRGGLEEGDSVTWNLGRIEGLDLEPEFWEPLVIGRNYVADIYLYYTQDGGIYLTTTFCEDISRMGFFSVTYWYDSGFRPVTERTRLELDLPGLEETGYVILLPEGDDGSQPTLPEETTTAPPEETTTAEETTPAETTAAEETTAVETEPPETLPEETTRGSGGGGSDSDSGRVKESVPVPETSAAAETEEETQAPVVEVVEEVSPEDSQNQVEQEGTEADENETEPESQEVSITLTEAVSDHGVPGQALPDEIITYRITIENNSEEPMEDVRIRSYLSDRVSFVLVEGAGVYGVVNGAQYITWNLDYIGPGEQQELVFQVRVFPCVPVGYPLDTKVFWQADDTRSVNNQEKLENEIVFPVITIG